MFDNFLVWKMKCTETLIKCYSDFYQALFLVFNMTDIGIQLLENCLETDMKLQYSIKIISKECNIGIFLLLSFL